MKKKEIACSHYKGEGYIYDLFGTLLLICSKCSTKLLKDMKEQEKLHDLLMDESDTITLRKAISRLKRRSAKSNR